MRHSSPIKTACPSCTLSLSFLNNCVKRKRLGWKQLHPLWGFNEQWMTRCNILKILSTFALRLNFYYTYLTIIVICILFDLFLKGLFSSNCKLLHLGIFFSSFSIPFENCFIFWIYMYMLLLCPKNSIISNLWYSHAVSQSLHLKLEAHCYTVCLGSYYRWEVDQVFCN